uniref:NTF2 domain-containing protein n=1 Tax=Ditylenchus dipsaci TaxID=166011 RepID=A0A915EUR4_9BILA
MLYRLSNGQNTSNGSSRKARTLQVFRRDYRRELGRYATDAKRIKEWYAKFQEGDLKNKKRVGTKFALISSLLLYLSIMEKVDGYNAPTPTDIGRAFVHQYYKKWSGMPTEVFTLSQFYGNDALFSHDGLEAKGQEDIRQAIEKLDYAQCKSRIHSLVCVNGLEDSLVLQVCGEMSVNGDPPRRFLQSLVLCKQAAKRYFVQNDIFQWLDNSFHDTTPADTSNVVPTSTAAPVNNGGGIVEENNELQAPKISESNASGVQQNGHMLSQPATLAELSSMASQPLHQPEVIPTPVVEEITAPEPIIEQQQQQQTQIVPENNITSYKEPTQKFVPNAPKNHVMHEENHVIHPKTWARAVSNSTSNNVNNVMVKTQAPIMDQPVMTDSDEFKVKDGSGDALYDENGIKSQQNYRDKRSGAAFHNGGGGGYRGGFGGAFRGPSNNRGGGPGGRGGGFGGGGFRGNNNNGNNYFRGGPNNGDGGQIGGGGPGNNGGGPPRFNGQPNAERRANNNNEQFRQNTRNVSNRNNGPTQN